MENLHRIETTLQQLDQPQWNEELLGAIDRGKAAQGENLFMQHCVSCHGPHKVEQKVKHAEAPLKGPRDPEWHVKLIDVDEIGTDPVAADNFVKVTYNLEKSGMTNQDADDLVRPYMIRALRNKVIAEFDSPYLIGFLATSNPQSSALASDIGWMQGQSWTLAEFEKAFNSGQPGVFIDV